METESLIREIFGSVLSSFLAILFMSALCKINTKEHKSVVLIFAALSVVNLFFAYSGNILFLQPLITFVVLLSCLFYYKEKSTVIYSLICELVMSISGIALPYVMALILGQNADSFLKIHGPVRLFTVFITNLFATIAYALIVRIFRKSLFSLTEIIT